MDYYVVGFIALDEILRFLSRGVVHVPFEPHVRNNFLHDYAANSARLRVPCNMITALEGLSDLAPVSLCAISYLYFKILAIWLRNHLSKQQSIIQDWNHREPAPRTIPGGFPTQN